MNRVLLSHPHANANAWGVARGLREAGLLHAFATGFAVPQRGLRGALTRRAAKRFGVLRNRIVEGDVPLSTHGVLEAGARVVGRASRRLGPRDLTYDAMFVAHDAAVAAEPWGRADAIYAYEDCALLSFRRARGRGVRRIWDLPLPHYATLEHLWAEEQARFPAASGVTPRTEPGWKKARKDQELALADHVTVASSFTHSSLRAAGFEGAVEVIPYGFPLDAFPMKGPSTMSGRMLVLSVGSQNLRKGTPYLLEAWRQARPNAELMLVGPLGLKEEFLAPYRDLFTHRPHATKAELRELYQRAELLAFPTLGDGFGLVMQESMCSGTPVVTTRCGGGPECIDDGVDGWIVAERDVDALAERIARCAEDREGTREIGRAARARAERYGWPEAGARIAQWIGGL